MSLDALKEGEEVARLLLARRQITAPQLDLARKDAQARGGRLATALLAVEAVDLDTLAALLGEVHGLDPAGLDELAVIPADALAALPARIAIRLLAVPFKRGPSGLDVALVEASAESVEAVAAAAGVRIRPHVAPEPLVYHALRRHHGLTRIPKPLEKIVNAIEAGSIRCHPGAVPEAPEEYVTTPMGGAVPHLPDDVTTNALAFSDPADRLTAEDILLGAGNDDALGVAIGAIAHASSIRDAESALLAWCGGAVEAAAILAQVGGEFRLLEGAGALAAVRDRELGDASRSVVRAALTGETGYHGAIPDTPANALLLEALGRDPREALLLPTSTTAAAERLVWADAGASAIDPATVERLRALVRRIRERRFS